MNVSLRASAPSATYGEPEPSEPGSSLSPPSYGEFSGKAPDLVALEEAINRLETDTLVPGDVQIIKLGFQTLRDAGLRLEDTIHHLIKITERFI